MPSGSAGETTWVKFRKQPRFESRCPMWHCRLPRCRCKVEVNEAVVSGASISGASVTAAIVVFSDWDPSDLDRSLAVGAGRRNGACERALERVFADPGALRH